MYAPHLRLARATVFAGAALLIGATPAFAGEEPIVSTALQDAKTATVSYADLNLLEDSAVDQLNRRVRNAARSVCDLHLRRQPIDETMRATACFKDTMARAERDVAFAVAEKRSGEQLASRESAIGVRSR